MLVTEMPHKSFADVESLQNEKLNAFEPFGEAFSLKTDNGSCTVELVLNEATFLTSIPALQAAGVLNPDITQTQINLMPYNLSAAFGLIAATGLTHELYVTNQSVDQCSFTQFISDADDFGAEHKIKMFSYTFDRALNQKIKWETFKTASFPKIAKSYKMGPEFKAKLTNE